MDLPASPYSNFQATVAEVQPPPARRRTQVERTARSDRLMFDAAVKLIGERGVQRTTLKDICELAGYSRGLANYRFGSKDAFIRAMIEQFNLTWQEHVTKVVGANVGLDAIIAALDALEMFLVEHADSMRGMYLIWYGSLSDSPEIQGRLADNHNAYRRDARRWLKEGIAQGVIKPAIDVDLFAVQYCALMLGTIYQWIVNPRAFDLHAIFGYCKSVSRQLLAEPANAIHTA